MTMVYFCVAALQLLTAHSEPYQDVAAVVAQDRDRIRRWVLSHLCLVRDRLSFTLHSASPSKAGAGFRGASLDLPRSLSKGQTANDEGPHLAMTYAALLVLLMVQDTLSAVPRDGIVAWLRGLQQVDGSFVPFVGSNESDMRFLFCACAISFILNDWSGVDRDQAVQFIRQSTNPDGAMGQAPGLESHGGSTYCALACLALMDRLKQGLVDRQRTIYWLVRRQISGFQGRVNKPADTCYAFWVGASLQMLDALPLVDPDMILDFLGQTVTPYGGFGKEPGDLPDMLHSYMGLAGWSLFQPWSRAITELPDHQRDAAVDLQPLVGMLNIPRATMDHLLNRSHWHTDASGIALRED